MDDSMDTSNLVFVAVVGILAFYFAFTQFMTFKPKGMATGLVVGIISYYIIRSIAADLLIYIIPALAVIAVLWLLSHRASVRRARERERQRQQNQQPRPGARSTQTGGNWR